MMNMRVVLLEIEVIEIFNSNVDAERGHMYKLIKMRDLFGLGHDLEKIIYMVYD